jgi:hypothetical protein
LAFFNDFTKQVDRHFSFLAANGFELLSNEASSSFDNGLAIFRSARLSIQVVRDRGDWFVEAGALGDLRYGDHLLAHVLPGFSSVGSAGVNHREPAAVAQHLRQMLPAIEAAFAPERATQTITALRRLGQT